MATATGLPTVPNPPQFDWGKYIQGVPNQGLPGGYSGGGFTTGSAGSASAGNPFLTSPQADVLKTLAQTTGSENVANLQNAGNLANTYESGLFSQANTQQQGLNQANVANIQGQSARDVANISGGYGVSEAEIGATPGLVNSAVGLEKFNMMAPYVQGILGEIPSLMQQVGQAIPGVAAQSSIAPGALGSTGGGPIRAPTSVIDPAQAQAMRDANTTQGNQGAVSNASALGLGSGNAPLDQQLLQQLSGQNSANLSSTANQFMAGLTPANANQALQAGQLQELVRSQQAQQALGLAGIPVQRLGSLANYVSGINSGLGGL